MSVPNNNIDSTMTTKFLTNEDISGEYDIKYFSGFYEHIYRDPFIGGNAFIFITRPQLFLINDPAKAKLEEYRNNNPYLALDNMLKEPKFLTFLENSNPNTLDKNIFQSLSLFGNEFPSKFLPMFTNQCKNFEAINVQLDTMDVFDTKQGFKEILPKHTTVSESGNQISMSVTEDINLSFTKLLNIWVTYINNITDGTFSANPDMILNGSIDYTSSIYYFVLGPDGQSLKYWCKYTGCYPINIPYSSLRYNKGSRESVELDISFTYNIKEDMNPSILEDFNIISLGYKNKDISSFIPTEQLGNTGFVYKPLLSNKLLRADTRVAFEGDDNTKEVDNGLGTKINEYKSDKDQHRDPIVVFTDSTKEFQLIFDNYAYKSELLSEILDDKLMTIDDKNQENKFEANMFSLNMYRISTKENENGWAYNVWAEENIKCKEE